MKIKTTAPRTCRSVVGWGNELNQERKTARRGTWRAMKSRRMEKRRPESRIFNDLCIDFCIPFLPV